MKKHISSNMKIVLTFILFVTLLLLFFVFEAKAEVNKNVNNLEKQEQSFQSRTVTLPSELAKSQIKLMVVGDIGYNDRKAMIVDEQGHCFLQGILTNEPNKEKDMKHGWIKIERKKDGYYVYIVKSEKTLWEREYISYQRDKLLDGDLIRIKNIIILKPQ